VAIPYYQENLQRMNDYLGKDYSDTISNYLQYSNESAMNDYLRAYQKAMSDMASNNYSATSGGYTSSGQQAVDDTQRYYNDLMSRLASSNLSNAVSMAQNEYSNIANAFNPYQQAYNQGANYSNIQQYNDQVDSYNKNRLWNNILGIGGSILGTGIGALTGNPYGGFKIGSAIGGNLGNMFSPVDTTTMDALLSRYTGAGVQSNPELGGYNASNINDIINTYKDSFGQTATPTTVSQTQNQPQSTNIYTQLQNEINQLKSNPFSLGSKVQRIF
jgi:hypothetical protein